MLNRFIELAPYPTQSSKVALLRILLLNASLSYFAEYFSTFFFRHDIWLERHAASRGAEDERKSSVPTSAADDEERLLREECQSNSALLFLFCFVSFPFLAKILTLSNA